MVNSVKKATDILQILSNNPGSCLTLGAIAQLSGINESTCAHIVSSLCDTFFIERVSRKEGYRLGPWAYMLSRKERYQEAANKAVHEAGIPNRISGRGMQREKICTVLY